MGRGRDFAWLATSAGADNVDQWVVKLCEPDGGQAHPEFPGLSVQKCHPMEPLNHSQQVTPWVKEEENNPRMKTK
ncbi:hypothetical protein [Kroppenstedtia guangzhouensis]|nr:hypothetical protein [Kroppenstedtia guangzhouensis]